MKTSSDAIYRLQVAVEDYQELKLTGPPLSVAPDRGGNSDVYDLWFEHNGLPKSWGIYVLGTGHPVPWNRITRYMYRFLGTVVTPMGLVWHVFTGPLR